MNELVSFKKTEDFSIKAQVEVEKNKLFFSFEIFDTKSKLKMPEPKDSQKRVIGLWDNACFEGFWAYENEPQYYEMNISPTGNWNVFEFQEYRKPSFPYLKESMKWKLSSFQRKENLFISNFESSEAFNSEKVLIFGLSAILVTKSGEKSFWALKHSKAKPDFHQRETFTLKKNI